MFQTVNNRASFPKIEEKILEFWKERKIFAKSIEARKGKQRFNFYEGPPTANGHPGIHHVLARVFKDVMPRYKTMKGYYTPRIAGWDTHGLPVELEVEKELGFTNKGDIEKFGIAEFNAKCRESVFRYVKEWDALTERIAFWVDLEHPYITMDNGYVESCWWAIKAMWDKGLIYQGYRVTPHCPRCGTSLSSHEVALGYRDDTEDPSVYIKFKLTEQSKEAFESKLKAAEAVVAAVELSLGEFPVYLLAWTTTPWTLPGNTALAIDADAEYAVVRMEGGYLILAEARLAVVGLGDAEIVAKIAGSKMVGLQYEPLFNPLKYGVSLGKTATEGKGGQDSSEATEKGVKLTYPVIATDYVTMDEGTGVVHTAPAFGEDDYDAGIKFGLYFVQPVDLQGRMTGTYPFAGRFVKEADPLIIENLKERGLLFKAEKIRHTYPFCWRCGTPLLYYAKQSWYIRTTAKKEALISGNEKIGWYPDYIKYGRFGDWLQNNVDWAFSRERYWGTPLPVWRCESCGSLECAGSIEDLRQKRGLAGFKEPLDLHRPFVDAITFDCAKCGGRMHRQSEVIDCWFDSGAMPFAQYHYPFEHQEEFRKELFPADFICEAVDQTRGWFYSLHAESTMLFDDISYRNVISLGHILDAKGEKMSKSRGNAVEPWVIINKFGADPLRWYCLTATPPGNARRFSEDMVADIVRRFVLTLWNVYSFFVTYANIDNFTPEVRPDAAPESELDRWIISELNELVADVDKELAAYNPTTAGRKIATFVNDLSNWYVRRSRRRFWKSESDADKLSAYHTLYECLVTLSKLLAPFMPFLAEELYHNLMLSVFPDAPESVHLTDFPVADMSKVDGELNNDMRLAMNVSSLGRAARSQAGIRVRQPLAVSLVKLGSHREEEGLKRMLQPVLEELNVKEIRFLKDTDGLNPDEYAITAEGDYAVAIPTVISPELLAEGMAREIVHRLQTMRREAKFDIADRIVTYYQGDAYLQQVMADFSSYIRQETLSSELVHGTSAEGAYSGSFKLSGHSIDLAVKKMG
ncbi:MAG: isoleucine--tRNA ligase [Chloroflexota bacterium]